MPNTITSGYDFTGGTRARKLHFNTNFGNFRGDCLPISETSWAATNNLNNWGAADRRFDIHYLKSLDLRTSTTTAGLVVEQNQAITTGALQFKIGATTVSTVKSDGFTPDSFSARGTDLTVGSVYFGSTYTANVKVTDTTALISTVQIKTRGGPVEFFLQHGLAATASETTTNYSGVAPTGILAAIILWKDLQTTTSIVGYSECRVSNVTTVANATVVNLPCEVFRFIDQPAAGTYTYGISARGLSTGPMVVRNCQLVAHEI